MENLEEAHCHKTEIKLENEESWIISDLQEGSVCVVDNNRLLVYEGNISHRDFIYKIDTAGPIRYVKYLAIFSIIFTATEKELILYDTENKKILFSLSVESPIVELSWNPLETLLVIVHIDMELTSYHYTRNYIQLVNKSSLNAVVPAPILSGWGSVSTQFRGPRNSKRAASNAEVIQSASDAPPKISWRGNGELFVVNYYVDNQRFLKVFDADLNALNQTEPFSSLQEPVAFMGQGQSIACCGVNNDGVTRLIIFEKNCAIKNEYDMPDIKGSVYKMQYHPYMNILAILSINENGSSYINIYLFSNGKCFLKQQLYHAKERVAHDFQWLNGQEPSFTTCKMIILTSRHIEYRTFRFIINRCSNRNTVAVIDGKRVGFTVFDMKITPPPLSYYFFEHQTPVNRILLHPIKRICVLVDSFYLIKVLHLTDDLIEDVMTMDEHSKFSGYVSFQSVNWESSIELELQSDSTADVFIKKSNQVSVKIKIVEVNTHIHLPYSDTPLLLPYKLIQNKNNYIYLTKHIAEDKDRIIGYEFALSSNRDFYVNDMVVCSGVTSFHIFDKYLIFTHSNSKLYCIRLRDNVLYETDINLNKVFSRDIEQGGIIVACANLISPQIILQMPRGNIETIGCKMITIDVIENLLAENSWDIVLQILRIEKVNCNVLIDLNPDRFLAHIEDFVKATKRNAILSNIVSEFSLNENCFQTFYRNYSPFSSHKLNYNKQNIVEGILQYLVSTDCINNLFSIVAIQQKHISLKAALKSIKDVFSYDSQLYTVVCSKVLKQVLVQEHFKDVENATYNLYDLKFLSFVYQNSPEDPKVYEPEIKALTNIGVMERKFKMSVRGKNFAGAVKYLLRWDTADEHFVRNFIVKNHIEDIAYFSIEDYHKHYQLVTLLYAKTLSILNKYTEAGMILKKAKLWREAMLEYKKGLDFREVTSLCSKLNFEADDEMQIFKELVETLVKENKIDDAVIMLETYCKDYKSAIEVLVQHNAFRKAICLAETYREPQFVETYIVPKLTNFMSDLLEKIDNYAKEFKIYSDRLNIIREERVLKLHMISLGLCDDQDDLYSEISSRVESSHSKLTSNSRGSTLSSRNRRKEERKKIDLKEGGYYEDIAIIRALYIMYIEVFNFGKEIREVCLIGYEYDSKKTRNLHENLCELQDSMVQTIPKIWSEVFIKVDESKDFEVLAIVHNKQDLDPQYRVPPSTANAKSWRLEVFS